MKATESTRGLDCDGESIENHRKRRDNGTVGEIDETHRFSRTNTHRLSQTS